MASPNAWAAGSRTGYGTLSPLLKRLEANGLVRRERRADDERSVLVAPTEDGATLRERARAVPGSIGEAMGLGDAELDQLRRLLRTLTGNVASYAARRRG